MADVKISQLTAKAAKVESTDRIPIADYNGTTYDTKYVTGSEINEVSLDTSPQLGGNLDVNGNTITSASNGNIQIRPNGTGAVLIGDSSGSNAAPLRFMELSDNGTNYVGLKAADNLSTNTTYTLPTADGTSGQVLSTSGTGTLSWTNNDSGLTVNSTAITSGTAGRVFFQNASNQLSQSANLFWDNTNDRLGIGIAVPTQKVHVDGNILLSTGTNKFVRIGSSTNYWYDLQSTGNNFQIIDGGGVPRLHISYPNGLVAIGSSSPGSRLDIRALNADLGDLALKVRDSTDVKDLFSVTNTGTVNISNFPALSSGTTTLDALRINPAINNTGTYSGIVRGIYYNPTLTSLTGTTHRAIETTAGNVTFNSTSGNVAIGGTSFGTSSDKVLAQYTGTAPGSSPADAYQQYSADITVGNAAPHFRTENGNIVKLYQETTGVAAATLVSNAGTTLTSTDTFDGYTLRQVVKALRNLGILA
jgi:hypothetical protein